MSNQYSSKPLTKPLKGGGSSSIIGQFDSVNANSLQLQSLNIAGVFEDGVFSNITMQDSTIINTVIGIDGPNIGYFTDLQTRKDVTFLSNISGTFVTWDPNTGLFQITSTNGSFKVDGCSMLGNIEICRNDIMATNLNGDINIIPDNLGTIYLKGPINNVSSNGSFYTALANGGVSFLVDKNIVLYSSHGSASLTTALGQNYSAINGDIKINVDTGATTKTITNVRGTSGNLFITTTEPHQLTSGNIVSISNGSLNGNFTVGNILSDNSFLLTSTIGSVFVTTGGNFLKTISNNIELNSNNFVKIPDSTKLSFGNTTNSISGTTSGLTVKSFGDIYYDVGSSNIIRVPQTTKLQFGTSGSNYINYTGSSLTINSADTIDINGSLTTIDTTNTKFSDPILTIGYNLTGNDNKDRGVEFPYYDSTTGSTKLGWFGFKQDSKAFALLTDATNNNEIISGNVGSLLLGSLTTSTIILTTAGTFNMNCGKLLNASLITGCSNTLTLAGSTNVNVNATNRISLDSGTDILIPNNIPLKYGTSGSLIFENTTSNLVITGSQNVFINTKTQGSIVIPIQTYISFDGSTSGAQKISSNTNGDLLINSNKGIFLTTTGGNIVIPSSTLLQLGNTSQNISGSSSGISIISSSTSSTLNLISNSDVNISSSFGNIILRTYNLGDIDLYASGNVRILPQSSLVFNTSGLTNSIVNSSGTFLFTGSSSNTLRLTDFNTIDLLASANINIPINTQFNVGDNQKYIYSNNSQAAFWVNTNTAGSISIVSNTTNINNNTNGTLNVINSTSNVSSSSFIISGSSGSLVQFNTDNVRIKDPIITIGDQTLISNDNKDRGVEYRYYSTAMKLGWSGLKNTTNRWTFYSDAINTSEVITGTVGDIEISNAYLRGNLNFIGTGSIDLGCGTIANVNTIIGCSGTINMSATTAINITTGTFSINATNQVRLPYNIPLVFGSTNTTGSSMSSDSNGNLTVNSGRVIFNSDVQINGTTSNVYSTVTNIQDPIISLGGVTGPVINDNKDRGIEFKWSDSISTKTGFFGYKNALQRFVFIQDGINNNEVFSGSFGNVQFGDGFFNNLSLTNGNITGVNVLSGGALTLQSTSGNINITPTSGRSVLLPYNTPLGFGTTQNSIQANTSGDMLYSSFGKTTLLSQTGGINMITSDFVRVPDSVPFYFGTSNNTYITGSSGSLSLINSQGNINLTPKFSTGSVNIPVNNYLNFGSSSNSIYSDNSQLILNGYNGIGINSSVINIAGTVNIIGTLLASNTDVDLNQYILPLGTSQYLGVTSVSNNTTGSGGNILITTSTIGNLSAGDNIKLKNTNTTPVIDGSYTITSVINPTTFTINASSLSVGSSNGSVVSNLTVEQGKDVGIQVNYWSTTGNTNITAGSAGYKTGFFGFKRNTERWSFYTNVTNNNNVVTGSLADIEVNKVFTSRLSGFILDGGVSCGSFNVAGSNFTISGGTINSTPIGASTPSTGRFTTLSNTVQASLYGLTMQSTLAYSFERYTLSSGVPTRSPSDSVIVSLFSVSGVNFTTSSGTMPNITMADGSIKILMCSSMGTGCSHTVYFGPGKLISPNPLSGTGIPTAIQFKRKGQSVQLMYDTVQTAWLIIGGGCYVV